MNVTMSTDPCWIGTERHREAIGDRIGYHNVEFHKARIQDLSPLISDDSVDVVVSNCVLNLVREEDRGRLFDGIRTLAREATAWQTVRGIEFRPLTVEASKGRRKNCC